MSRHLGGTQLQRLPANRLATSPSAFHLIHDPISGHEVDRRLSSVADDDEHRRRRPRSHRLHATKPGRRCAVHTWTRRSLIFDSTLGSCSVHDSTSLLCSSYGHWNGARYTWREQVTRTCHWQESLDLRPLLPPTRSTTTIATSTSSCPSSESFSRTPLALAFLRCYST